MREAVGIDKDVVVLGVRDRMEIWDRASYERYEAAVRRRLPGRDLAAARGYRRLPTKEVRDGRQDDSDAPGKLGTEVRQSLSLIGMTALTLVASIAFGLFVGHIG